MDSRKIVNVSLYDSACSTRKITDFIILRARMPHGPGGSRTSVYEDNFLSYDASMCILTTGEYRSYADWNGSTYTFYLSATIGLRT